MVASSGQPADNWSQHGHESAQVSIASSMLLEWPYWRLQRRAYQLSSPTYCFEPRSSGHGQMLQTQCTATCGSTASLVLHVRIVTLDGGWLQVASLLLLLCLAYDVFWVFIQPLFSHGTSVMVEVRSTSHMASR